jgi:hypothetical protein
LSFFERLNLEDYFLLSPQCPKEGWGGEHQSAEAMMMMMLMHFRNRPAREHSSTWTLESYCHLLINNMHKHEPHSVVEINSKTWLPFGLGFRV